MTGLRVNPARAALLIVDVQQKLSAAMEPSLQAAVERNLPILAEAARRFDLPIVVSQQYPQGLGATIQCVDQAVGQGAHRFDKVAFSVCDAEPFEPIRQRLGRDQWIIAGMESHVCVYQSARALCDRGASVHVARDAVASRTVANYDVGLALIERAGAVVSCTEAIVFDLLARAGGEHFKALSKLIR